MTQQPALVLLVPTTEQEALMTVLSQAYQTVTVASQEEAAALLRQDERETAGLLLYGTEEPSRYGPLLRIAEQAGVPVLAMAERQEWEEPFLREGAWDFVWWPVAPAVLQVRVQHMTRRGRQLRYGRRLQERDDITGIYRKEKFFSCVKEKLATAPAGQYALVRMDIDRFSLINAFFGVREGDQLLQHIAGVFTRFAKQREPGLLYGRIEADTFGLLMRYEEEKSLRTRLRRIDDDVRRYNVSFDISPTFGVYRVEDLTLPVDSMFDKANLAAKQSKGHYSHTISFYTDQMGRTVEWEQQIMNEMNEAIRRDQFYVYLQPKYNLQSHTLSGAEALVRWHHPKWGVLRPSEFIPVFERNGFIARLDRYMWEKTCQILNNWLREGKAPRPVSVNVSRVNMYNPHLADVISGITRRYGVPNKLLQLEMTESAYTDNPVAMKQMLQKLHDKGFTILMDDFGSGYSSLNVLKNMPVDLIKIDMQFLGESDVPGRGENIIASVVRMAKWLQIPTVAEGVEKPEQVSFLRGIGCEYIQGYYLSPPMLPEEYEVFASQYVEREEPQGETSIDRENFWVSNPHLHDLFTDVEQPLAIYEYTGDDVQVLRINKAFSRSFGYRKDEKGRVVIRDMMEPEALGQLLFACRCASQRRGSAECEYRRYNRDGQSVWVHINLRYLSRVGSRIILFGVLTDISLQKELEEELFRYRTMMPREEERPRIMLMDYSDGDRRVLRSFLTPDYAVYEVKNGEKALEILHQQPMDLILLSTAMKETGVADFLQTKKHDARLSPIPVMAVVEEHTMEEQGYLLEQGVSDVLIPPLLSEIVRNRVQNLLRPRQTFQAMMKNYEEMLRAAQSDSLTGLFTRATAEEMITQSLQENGGCGAFFMLDIDDFKIINDTRGHQAGDRVMAQFAEVLRRCFRKSDILARFGGDEFVVFMPDVTSRELIRERCRHFMQEAGTIEENGLTVSCSVGISLCPEHGCTVEELYRQADHALYEAKRQGKNRFSFYGKDQTEE